MSQEQIQMENLGKMLENWRGEMEQEQTNNHEIRKWKNNHSQHYMHKSIGKWLNNSEKLGMSTIIHLSSNKWHRKENPPRRKQGKGKANNNELVLGLKKEAQIRLLSDNKKWGRDWAWLRQQAPVERTTDTEPPRHDTALSLHSNVWFNIWKHHHCLVIPTRRRRRRLNWK